MTRPPIVELVIGVQFDPLAGLSNGHLGRFWAEVAREYPEVSDAPPIAPVVESFTDDVEFGAPMIAVLPTRGDSRLRMASEAGYMVQVQNGWFVTNWIKRGDARYPGFAAVRGVFDRELARFSSHLASAGLGALVPNMWEVTYIDHVAKSELWRGGQDTSRVLPGLLSAPRIDGGECEAVSGAWSFRLSRCRGRLAVTVQTVRRRDGRSAAHHQHGARPGRAGQVFQRRDRRRAPRRGGSADLTLVRRGEGILDGRLDMRVVGYATEYEPSGEAEHYRPVTIVAETGAATDPEFTIRRERERVLAAMIDRLLAWYRDPASVADDDVESPSRTGIRAAIELLRGMQSGQPWQGLTPRGVSVSTGGSISLAFRVNSHEVDYECDPAGNVECLVFHQGRLVLRRPIGRSG